MWTLSGTEFCRKVVIAVYLYYDCVQNNHKTRFD